MKYPFFILSLLKKDLLYYNRLCRIAALSLSFCIILNLKNHSCINFRITYGRRQAYGFRWWTAYVIFFYLLFFKTKIKLIASLRRLILHTKTILSLWHLHYLIYSFANLFWFLWSLFFYWFICKTIVWKYEIWNEFMKGYYNMVIGMQSKYLKNMTVDVQIPQKDQPNLIRFPYNFSENICISKL